MCDTFGETEEGGRTVLCGANAYEGGIFTIVFEKDGSIVMETDFAPDDFLYDEISSGLMVREVRRNRQELFEALQLYYRVFVLHEQVDAGE